MDQYCDFYYISEGITEEYVDTFVTDFNTLVKK